MYTCLTPGCLVCNDLGWHGVVTEDERGHWLDAYEGDVHVHWMSPAHDGWFAAQVLQLEP